MRLMLLLENHWFRRRVMRAFVSKPKLFKGLLATHVGDASTIQAATNGVALGLKLLTQ